MISFENAPKIVVIGDLMIDHYLWGTCHRISPEAPVQVVHVDKETKALGGAGNVINNLKALGAEVTVLSVVGDGENSQTLRRLLEEVKVDPTNILTEPGRITSQKSRIFAAQQQVVRFDRESTEDISLPFQQELIARFTAQIQDCDVVLLSDYGKGVLTNQVTQQILSIANQHNRKVLVDPKGNDYSKYKGAYLLTPNRKEASEATGIDIKDDASLLEAIQKLKTICELDVSLITLSSKGVAIFDTELRKYPTVAQEVFDVTGAGDTVLASLGVALATSTSIDEAVRFANLAAGVVVGKIGSATATLQEIKNYAAKINSFSHDSPVVSFEEITEIAKDYRQRGKKIVFTNGCFDLLHSGHVQYLKEARSYGDVLILGLNSDASVSRLKGPDRPINPQEDRALILSALEAVDHVVVFEDDTPYELIKAIQPHILVKGGDYEGKSVVGEDLVDELRLVKFVDGRSTTKMIQKINRS